MQNLLEFKFRAYTYQQFKDFQKLMNEQYSGNHIFELTLEDNTDEEGEVEALLKTSVFMSPICKLMSTLPNNDLMIQTFNSASVYTGKRWNFNSL